ncbi:copper chaperone PCu(A)C [Streptomyces flavofungini]|uniref:copper chaperone PCu(A)C n=1 Tax=Streptomyces flavofungini TaxID=68200 RepID=UPI0025B0F900|nr:copper chaperone PCu(A)C [Streptomyces flavofungini]WJV45616.1 copper chaperone PCu(A)C [Streptomyces flavofungini]
MRGRSGLRLRAASGSGAPGDAYARLRSVLPGVLAPVLAPVLACAVALCGLSAWVAAGAAGSPARVAVDDGRVFLPYGGKEETAAFFRITNTGESGDELVSVRSPVADDVMLSRTVERAGNVESMRMVDSAAVPARSVVRMTPEGLDVMLRPVGALRLGDEVPFVLRFRHSGEVTVRAVVVRPGS